MKYFVWKLPQALSTRLGSNGHALASLRQVAETVNIGNAFPLSTTSSGYSGPQVPNFCPELQLFILYARSKFFDVYQESYCIFSIILIMLFDVLVHEDTQFLFL